MEPSDQNAALGVPIPKRLIQVVTDLGADDPPPD